MQTSNGDFGERYQVGLLIASILASSLILHTSRTISRLSAHLQILLSIKFLTFDPVIFFWCTLDCRIVVLGGFSS